jgi:hypothetical protein
MRPCKRSPILIRYSALACILPAAQAGNLLFLGPTGSGKMRTVEFGDSRAVIKVDCAELSRPPRNASAHHPRGVSRKPSQGESSSSVEDLRRYHSQKIFAANSMLRNAKFFCSTMRTTWCFTHFWRTSPEQVAFRPASSHDMVVMPARQRVGHETRLAERLVDTGRFSVAGRPNERGNLVRYFGNWTTP